MEKVLATISQITKLTEFENNIYVVGGYVRDILLGNNPKDIDLCIDVPNGTDKFINYLKENHNDICSGFVEYPRYKTAKFSIKVDEFKFEIECVVPRVEKYGDGPRKPSLVSQSSILEDSLRRDFCCNALYFNIHSQEIIDPTEKGIEDCKTRVLRTPCDPVVTFRDDPLRMLRAIRFSTQKGFKISEEVLRKIYPYPEYFKLSMERVNSEFTKILMSSNPSFGIRLLKQTNLLQYISPELDHAWGFDQKSKYHSLNLTDHMLKVLDILSINRPETSLELRLAALFHDISKATDYQLREDGRYSFHGHEVSSAHLAKDILKRLKYSSKLIDKVFILINSHMILKSTAVRENINEDYSFDIKPKRVRKIIRELGDNLLPVLELIDADNLSHDLCYQIIGQKDWFLNKVKSVTVEINPKLPNKVFNLPLTGNDILKYYNRTDPGPWVKDVLKLLQEYYDENPTLSKDQLLEKLLRN